MLTSCPRRATAPCQASRVERVSVPRQSRPNRVLAVPVPRCFSDTCKNALPPSGQVQDLDDRPWVPFGQQIVSSQKFGETDSDSQDAPKRICFAFALMISASEDICLAPDTLSLMYAYTLTPSFLAVSTRVIPVSQAWTPSAVRGPTLTSLFRTRARAPHSAALLCNGTSG